MEDTDQVHWDWVELLSDQQKLEAGRLFMLLFLTNTRLWLANFCKILELEKARRNVSTSIIDDDLKLLSGKSDFDFEALSKGASSNPVDYLLSAPKHRHPRNSTLPELQEDAKLCDENDKDESMDLVDFDTLIKLLPSSGFVGDSYDNVSPELKLTRFCSNRWLLISDITVTLLSLVLYVVETYSSCCPPHLSIVIMEWIIFAIFCLIASIKFYVLVSYYLFSFQGFIDTFVSLPPTPIYIAYGVPLGYFRWLRLITLFLVYYRNQMPFTESNGVLNVELNRNYFIRQVCGFVLSIAAALFTMAGTILALSLASPDNFEILHAEELTLQTSLYFCFNSLLTIDTAYIIVQSTISQAIVGLSLIIIYLLILCMSVMVVPNLRRNWANFMWGKRYKPGSTREKHVVICGNIQFKTLAAALQDIYHDCNGLTSHLMRVVVLSDRSPDLSVQKLLSLGYYRKRVQYIKGRPVNRVDRDRADVHNAQCILVLANDSSVENKQAEDMEAMMTAISLTSNRPEYGGGEQLVLVGLNLPNSETHMRNARYINAVSSQALKLSILAQCTRCPGWATMISNLICNHLITLNKDLFEEGSWLAEYCTGAIKKFYCMPFSPWFENCIFSEVAQFCYQHFGLVLVAVETNGSNGLYQLTINPGPNYVIGNGDAVFLLGDSYQDAVLVWKYVGQAYENSEAGKLAELMGRVSLDDKFIRSGDDFVKFVNSSSTLANCRETHPKNELPNEELGVALLDAFEQNRDPSTSIWKQLANLGLATDTDSDSKNGENASQASTVPDSSDGIGRSRERSIRQVVESNSAEDSEDGGLPEESVASPCTESGVKSFTSDCFTSSSIDGEDVLSAKPGDRKQESRQEHSLYRCRTGVCSFITNAEHLAGHVVIMGFQHHVSFLYCFLDGVLSGLSVKPLVFMTPDAQQLSDALVCLEGMDSVPLKGKEILILPGDPMKYQDLKKAGICTAHTVILLHMDPLSSLREMKNGGNEVDGDLLDDSQTLFSFLKMVDGLLCEDGNIVVEILNEQTLAYMHTKQLSQCASIAFRKLPVESCAFMWPLYAAGKVFHSSRTVAALLSSSIYQPSLINFILQLVGHDVHRLDFKEDVPHTTTHDELTRKKILPVQQIAVPSSMVGESFGNLYQQLLAPPLHIVALGLYRCKGTRGSPEPFVYTGCRADTMLNHGDRAL